jgi:hypothetical protein
MDSHETFNSPHTTGQWVEWLLDEIINPDLGAEETHSILHHLADLKIFKSDGEGAWKLSGLEPNCTGEDARLILQELLAGVSATEPGFALIYFFPRKDDLPLPPLQESEDSSTASIKKSLFTKSKASGVEVSSDLSTLQIVKRWGNHLRPFLDLEEKVIARLKGKYTTREDAQRLFSYILDKTRKKTSPKQWEQLSRKRHR